MAALPDVPAAGIPVQDPEKHSSVSASTAPSQADTHAALPVCPPTTTPRRLQTKIDLRLVPFVILLYAFAFLDRVNIGNARAFGMVTDLHLDGTKYNTALTIFFVPYIIFEIPANLLMKRLNPKVWLPACMLAFGVITTVTGLVQNYAGLLACRFFLGVFESAMLAGSFYLLGTWYRREEAAKRFCLFFQSTSLAGAFGGLLASAIGKMDGIRGYHGWRWIFILEGILTVVVAVVFFFSFPPFPEEASWLTPDERAYVQARLRADQGAAEKDRPTTVRDFLILLRDVKVWLGWFMYFGLLVSAYSFAFFSPSIIQGYGFSPIESQLRSVPPYASAFGLSLVIAYFSDLTRHRFLFALAPLFVSIASFGILLSRHMYDKSLGTVGLDARYAGICMMAMGTLASAPICVCWFQMNLGGHQRKALGSAFQIGGGNLGAFIATYAFIATDAPFYTPGFAVCLAFQVLVFFAICTYALCVVWENKKKAKDKRELTPEEKKEMGDLSPDFKYML